jgi:hypothetical protein
MLLDSAARPAAAWPGLPAPRVRVPRIGLGLGLILSTLLGDLARAGVACPPRKTEVAIRGDGFLINGQPTYAGRAWRGRSVEGLLLNSRMVQGIFDDLNPETQAKWAYPDTGRWDPERDTREFLAATPEWRRHGLLAFTINLQGSRSRE